MAAAFGGEGAGSLASEATAARRAAATRRRAPRPRCRDAQASTAAASAAWRVFGGDGRVDATGVGVLGVRGLEGSEERAVGFADAALDGVLDRDRLERAGRERADARAPRRAVEAAGEAGDAPRVPRLVGAGAPSCAHEGARGVVELELDRQARERVDARGLELGGGGEGRADTVHPRSATAPQARRDATDAAVGAEADRALEIEAARGGPIRAPSHRRTRRPQPGS